MSARQVIDELTAACAEVRAKLERNTNTDDRRALVSDHLKAFSDRNVRIPDFKPGLEWFNVFEALSINRHLSGKLIVLDFFTYCCINCMHILPDLRELENQFSIEHGLVVIGVHSAKFTNERDTDHLFAALQRYGIYHPVVNDIGLSCWKNLGIVCWPTLLLIGPAGQPLAVFMGEGHKQELFLYVDVALNHFKSLGRISNHGLPVEPVRRLLPDLVGPALLFPGKVTVALLHSRGERIVISDTGNNRILIANTAGKVENVIGGCEAGFRDGGFANARFNGPQGVSALENSLFVADTGNHAVRKIDLEKETVDTVVGTGCQGRDLVGGQIGRDQALCSPWDLSLYWHDSEGKNVPVLFIAVAGTHQIWCLFLEDTVWWKNRKYKAGVCAAIVGSGREENRNNAYPHAAGFAQPSGLAVDQQGKAAFVADSESSAIRRINLKTGHVTGVCGANKDPTDLHDYGDIDGVGNKAKLQHPLGVSWNPIEQAVYVADTYNHKIKRIDMDSGQCKTVFGQGQPNTCFTFDEPSGLAINGRGDSIYVADTNHHAVKVISLLEKSAIATVMIRISSQSELTAGVTCTSEAVELTDNESGRERQKDREEEKEWRRGSETEIETHNIDTVISTEGGELTLTFAVSFKDDVVKLSRNPPAKWSFLDLPRGNGREWTVQPTTGILSTPISVHVGKGTEIRQFRFALDLIGCTECKCIPKKLHLVYNVRRKSDAPHTVVDHRNIIVSG